MHPIILAVQRIVKTALQNMWRNKFLSFATIIVMTLTLFIFNIILAINLTVNNILKEANDKVDIIVYLKDTTDFFQIQTIIDELKQLEGVKDVIYTSKEEALETVLKQYSSLENPFSKYNLENKLPSHIQIRTSKPEYHKKIISFLSGSSYSNLFMNIESSKETQEIAEKLSAINHAAKMMGIALLVSFIIGGVIIVVNAISLTLYNRKEEVYIMKLVGANLAFIKLPFIVEGVLLGVIASLFSILILITLTAQFDVPYGEIKNALNQVQRTTILQIIMSGMIGSFGSIIATRKYLSGKEL